MELIRQQIAEQNQISVEGAGTDQTDTGAMDTMEDVGAMSAAGPKAGSGVGPGAAGLGAINAPSTLELPRQRGAQFRHELHQGYRWMIPACLTTHGTQLIQQTAGESSIGKSLWAHRIKVGSSVHFNMEQLFQYMDPSTYWHLCNNCTSWGVDGAKLEVWSLGVRAPYSTNSSAIEVANANLQAQVMDISPIQHDYVISAAGNENPDNYYQKITGDTHQNVYTGDASPLTSTWANVSARFETRSLRKRVIIDDLYYSQADLIAQGRERFGLFDIRVMDPNLTNYIRKSVNGSNMLGKAFEHHYPVRGIFKSIHGTQRPLPSNFGHNGVGNQHDNSKINTLTYADPFDTNDKPSGSPATENVFDFQSGAPTYPTAKLSGILSNNQSVTKGLERHACYAIYNVRNVANDVEADTGSAAYNQIVDMNWEIITVFRLTIFGEHITPLYYNPVNQVAGYRNRRMVMRSAGPLSTTGADSDTNVSVWQNRFDDAYADSPHGERVGLFAAYVPIPTNGL